VDKAGNTIDFLLRAQRDKVAARRHFEKAIARNGEPETVTIDKSGLNLAALQALNAERETPIRIRQKKYLSNVVEQDHRAIKRRTRPMLGSKNFHCARIIPGGIELMHMIVKGQMKDGGRENSRPTVLLVGRMSIPHHIDICLTHLPYRDKTALTGHCD
jgi:transposase-like protein